MKSESDINSIQPTTLYQVAKSRRSNYSNARSSTNKDDTTSSNLYRRIHKMHYEDEMTQREIAVALNMHRSTVGDIFKKNDWIAIRSAGKMSKECYPSNF